jgi:hypothetical protein
VQDLKLFVYDDEPKQWTQVEKDEVLRQDSNLEDTVAACRERLSHSQRHNISVVLDEFGSYSSGYYGVLEHFKPRRWTIVLANCEGFQDVYYEVRFVGPGVYNEGTGPGQCRADPNPLKLPMTAILSTLVVGTVALVGLLIRQVYEKKAAQRQNYAPPSAEDAADVADDAVDEAAEDTVEKE